jgi:diguanylate cyclase (GGDEF)-like protein
MRYSKRKARFLHATRTLIASLTRGKPEPDVLQASIKGLADLIQVKCGAIILFDEQGGLSQFVHTGMNAETTGKIAHLPVGTGSFGKFIRENTALRSDDLACDPHGAGFLAHHPCMKSLLAVPISHHERMYGRLYLCDKFDMEAFSDEDEELALCFADALALILENERRLAELKEEQGHLVHSAFHDQLTNLPNRVLLCDRIGQVMNQASRKQQQAAILFCDLDGFKAINDSIGHHAGDLVLKTVSERLLNSVRGEDTVARIGGDEFVVVLSNIEFIDQVRVGAQKILDAISESVKVDGDEIILSGSIGIAIYPFDGEATERLIRNADATMYMAKGCGKNNYRFFRETGTQEDASRPIVPRTAPWHERTGKNRIFQHSVN